MRSEEILAVLLPAAKIADELEAEFRGGAFFSFALESAGAPAISPVVGRNELYKLRMRGSGFNLDPHGVLSSDGFNSGGVFDKFLAKWGKNKGWALQEEAGGGEKYLDSQYLLWVVWEGLLKPECTAGGDSVTLRRWKDNPVRWVKSSGGFKAPHNVYVGLDELVRITCRTFPVRSGAWLRVFSSVSIRGNATQRGYFVDQGVGRKSAERLATAFENVVELVGSDAWEFFVTFLNRGGWGAKPDASFTEAAWATAGALGVG